MSDQARLDKLYREELHALTVFSEKSAPRIGFVGATQDPDVRRLLEAMAFFSARTRAAAAHATMTAVVRMAGGTLDDLFASLPAAAMVQLEPDEKLVTDAPLEQGTRLRFEQSGRSPHTVPRSALRAGAGRRSDEHVGIFTTKTPLTVRPLQVVRAQVLGPRFAQTVEIEVRARVPQRTASKLDFYVQRQGSYEASLEVHAALAHHVRQTTARIADDASELPCTTHFGARPPATVTDRGDGDSPMEKLRSFFQLPQQDLFVCVDVPALEAGWTTLTLRFALDAEWPDTVKLSGDTFLLHVVPVTNRWFDFSAPIAFDGTRSDIPVTYPLATPDAVEPQSVRGVYQVDRGMQPLLPLAVGQSRDGYEILRASEGPIRLRLRLADAFEQPRKLLADVEWSQPTLWEAPAGPVSVSLQEKAIAGVSLRLVGGIAPPRPSELSEDPPRALDILGLKMRGVLDRDALTSLMVLLGASGDSVYSQCPSRVASVTVRDAADPGLRAGGVKHVYDIALLGRREGPLGRFAEQIRALLDAWTQDAVNVRVSFAQGAAR